MTQAKNKNLFMNEYYYYRIHSPHETRNVEISRRKPEKKKNAYLCKIEKTIHRIYLFISVIISMINRCFSRSMSRR